MDYAEVPLIGPSAAASCFSGRAVDICDGPRPILLNLSAGFVEQ